MADQRSDAGDGMGAQRDRASSDSTPPRAPRWVKASAIIVAVLILLVVIVKLTDLGGDHGPGRHSGGDSTPPASVTTDTTSPGAGHVPPASSHG